MNDFKQKAIDELLYFKNKLLEKHLQDRIENKQGLFNYFFMEEKHWFKENNFNKTKKIDFLKSEFRRLQPYLNIDIEKIINEAEKEWRKIEKTAIKIILLKKIIYKKGKIIFKNENIDIKRVKKTKKEIYYKNGYIKNNQVVINNNGFVSVINLEKRTFKLYNDLFLKNRIKEFNQTYYEKICKEELLLSNKINMFFNELNKKGLEPELLLLLDIKRFETNTFVNIEKELTLSKLIRNKIKSSNNWDRKNRDITIIYKNGIISDNFHSFYKDEDIKLTFYPHKKYLIEKKDKTKKNNGRKNNDYKNLFRSIHLNEVNNNKKECLKFNKGINLSLFHYETNEIIEILKNISDLLKEIPLIASFEDIERDITKDLNKFKSEKEYQKIKKIFILKYKK